MKMKNYTSELLDDLLDEISQEEQEITDKKMLLAARIDDAIKSKKWKRKDFAKAMNKQASEISKWLSGTHNFNTDTLFSIERVLGVKLINLPESLQEQVLCFNFNVSQKVEQINEFSFSNIFDDNLNIYSKNLLEQSINSNKNNNKFPYLA